MHPTFRVVHIQEGFIDIKLVIVKLDLGNDDYWRHGQSKYVDLYNCAFMEPAEPNAVMPTGW